jgi:hypothetical protein
MTSTVWSVFAILVLVIVAGGCRSEPGPFDQGTNFLLGDGFGAWNAPEQCVRVDGSYTVDDENGCDEWEGVTPLLGTYARFYLRVTPSWTGPVGSLRLHLLNDWHLREDVDICGGMYNLFQFRTGSGLQHWEVKVFGDGTATVMLNGAPLASNLVESGYSFGPSPTNPRNHTQFEFAIEGVATGEVVMTGHDPAMATLVGGVGPASVQTVQAEECADPEAANVAEPRVFVGSLSSSGVAMTASEGTFGVALYPAKLTKATNNEVRLVGRQLEKVEGVHLKVGTTKEPTKFEILDSENLSFAVEVTNPIGVGEVSILVDGAEQEVGTVTWVVQSPPPGTPCDDGKSCTSGDAWTKSGSCEGTLDCPSHGPCQPALCGTDGGCDYGIVPPAQQKSCDDGNACTEEDVCGAGGVCGGVPINATTSCDDGNVCTEDGCAAASGCIHTPVEAKKPCTDGNACTINTVCSGTGLCGGGSSVKCIPSGPNASCLVGSCDPVAGSSYSSQQDGAACVHTGGDVGTCLGGVCLD